MFDPERLLKQMVGSALGGGHKKKRHKYDKYDKYRQHGGGGSGGLGGALGGLLGGGGSHRGSGYGSGGIGGVGKATVGLGLLGVAMAAYEHYKGQQGQQGQQAQQGQPGQHGAMPPVAPGGYVAPGHRAAPVSGATPPPPPPPRAAGPSAPTITAPVLDARQQEAALLVRAMIAAAAADGHIDEQERANIIERARAAGDDADTVAWLHAELNRPLTLDQLIAQTPVTLADEVYAASLLSIEPDHPLEHDYLQRLARALRIDEAQQRQLQAQLGLD